MDKRVDSFVDKFLEKWTSSCVDIRIRVRNFVDPIEVTVVIYDGDVLNTLCKAKFGLLIMHALPNSDWLMVMSSVQHCTVHDLCPHMSANCQLNNGIFKIYSLLNCLVKL